MAADALSDATAYGPANVQLHLAAAEGRAEVIAYLCDRLHSLDPYDRWGNTPLDDALRHGHDAVADLLRAHGGRRGRNRCGDGDGDASAMPA